MNQSFLLLESHLILNVLFTLESFTIAYTSFVLYTVLAVVLSVDSDHGAPHRKADDDKGCDYPRHNGQNDIEHQEGDHLKTETTQLIAVVIFTV